MEKGSAINVQSLEESRVVIAGGTSGVGLASARVLASAGVRHIVLMGRNQARGSTAVKQVREANPECGVDFIPVDANSVEAVRTAVVAAASALGRIDVLVNTTSSEVKAQLLFNTPLEDIEDILLAQALAPMLLSRAVLPVMREQRGGSIINVASDAGKVATPGETVIGGAMAAIIMFSRALAIEAKRDGIRVNVLTPSLISGTPTSDRQLSDPFGSKLFSKAIEMASLGVAEPDDLANLVVFLAGPGSARLTGQAISVNGGISAA